MIGPSGTTLCLLIRLFKEIKFKRATGSWFKKENSRVLKPDGKIRWSSLIPLIANICTNFGFLLVMSVGWKLAKASGIN